MDNKQITNPSSGIRKSRYTCLKDQQCSLNMRIRLAMQIHDTRVCEDLEKELQEVTEQIDIL
ncbi:MAG: hypothetical protein HFG41_03195 [Coprococcus sp.]|nr:hypothetical protein [Coprococcus sp.]